MALSIQEATPIYKAFCYPLVLLSGLVLYLVRVVIHSYLQYLLKHNLAVRLGYSSGSEHSVFGMNLFDLIFEAIAFL